MKTTALIMAGGRGERFWPKSRTNLPKQFLSLTGDGKTMIQLTVDRITPLVNLEDIYIATNKNYKSLVMEQLPGIPEGNILCEPVGRNTAPCIGLGAAYVASKYDDAVMMVLPSDHLIHNEVDFRRVLSAGIAKAESGPNLVTIGITPTYPETGYGYICYAADRPSGGAYEVDRFVEKPCRELAEEYLASGNYLWNSGMFLWKISTIQANLRTHMPDLAEGLTNIAAAIRTPQETQVLEEVFPTLPSESIDYGIMEKADNIFIFPGNFGWDDVGSWLAIERLRDNDALGNTVTGNVATVDTKNCIIEGSSKLIAAIGLEDLVIVDTADATLICHKNQTGDIKKLLAELKAQNKTEYL